MYCIENNALEYLRSLKKSKGAEIKHNYIGIQNYLKPDKYDVKIQEKQMIFQIRSRMVNVKKNFTRMYEV